MFRKKRFVVVKLQQQYIKQFINQYPLLYNYLKDQNLLYSFLYYDVGKLPDDTPHKQSPTYCDNWYEKLKLAVENMTWEERIDKYSMTVSIRSELSVILPFSIYLKSAPVCTVVQISDDIYRTL